MKSPLHVIAIVGLVFFYCQVIFFTLNPNVSEEYSSYYIKHSTNEWRPLVYTASLSEGFDFSSDGIPNFIKSVSGVSGREDWGRWSDATLAPAARIVYHQPFSGSVCVALKCLPATSQEGKSVTIRFGESEKQFMISPDGSRWHVFHFELNKPSNLIEIEPTSSAYASKIDRRKIGIGLERLIVTTGQCGDTLMY